MQQYKIEKNIKIPSRSNKWGHLFDKMGVMDSFAVGRDRKECTKMISAAYGFGRKNKMSFAFRKTEGGVYRI